MKFGENLKQIRKQKNISQEDLADKLGVARQSISKWETGENYPSMNNILCLCDIFNCKINDLVHEDFVDINHLDDEIKMSVVKFKKEKQKKVKTLSNILAIIGQISSIVIRVGMGFLVAMMVLGAVVYKSIDFKDDKIVAANEVFKVDETEDGIQLSLVKKNNVIIDIKNEDVDKIKTGLKHRDKTTTIILMECGFVVMLIFLIIMDKVMVHLHKLFTNIKDGDTPFTLENVDHIKKMSYLMIAAIVSSSIGAVFFNLTVAMEDAIEFNLFDIVEIIFLFALAYIFEYGYEIQRDSKGKIYGEEESEKEN